MLFKREDYTMENGKLQAYAWPGCYPLYYLLADSGVLCPSCANLPETRQAIDHDCQEDRQWLIVGVGVNWEGDAMYCGNCNKQIESEYGEDSNNDTN